jgi:protein-tyrosine phosphatase
MARLLRDSGADEGAFAARRLTEKLLTEADLVLTLTRDQRSLAVALWPPVVRRTFTLREFARLIAQVDLSVLPDETPGERLWSALPQVVARRGLRRTSAEDDDVIDPYRLSDDVYAASFTQITTAVEVIAESLISSKA